MGAPKGYTYRGTFSRKEKGLLKADQGLVRYAGFKTRTVREGDQIVLYIKVK